MLGQIFKSSTKLLFENQKIVKQSLILRNYSSAACKFQEAKIVPDVICTAPEKEAKICYAVGPVVMGSEMTPTDTKCMPKQTDWGGCKTDFHTLIMVDPDMPCQKNPCERNWLHWLVVNIPGNDFCKGEQFAEYVGPIPAEGTGCHRYVFLVYKQKCELNFDEQKIPKTCANGRPKFDVREFAKKYELCDPIAGNFFTAQYDCAVKEIRKSLGI